MELANADGRAVLAAPLQDAGQTGAAPAALALLAVEAEPAAEEHHVSAGLHRLHREADAVGEGDYPAAEEAMVKKLRLQLKEVSA